MTDDDDKNKKPRSGKATGGDGKPRAAASKRYDGGPDRKKSFGKKPAGKKPFAGKGDRPFAKRRDEGGEGSARSPDGPRKPLDRKPRDGKSFEKRAYGDKPYAKKPYEKKSYTPREETADEAGERPARSFDGPRKPFDRKPRDGKPFEKRPYGDKPYAKKPRNVDGSAPRPGRREREGAAGERTEFVAERPARDDRRPEWKGERKPYDKGGRRPFEKSAERRSFEKKGDRQPFDNSAERRGGAPFRERDGERRGPARDEAPAEAGERIAKRLARVGIASRRDAEELIAAGRVRVNGRVLASPAFNVMPDDRIELDGTEIPAVERTRLFLFHKPAGVVTTNRDPEGRRTVFDILPEGLPRLMTVGRLDINTEGLLLLTNDGGLARVLELPATGWLRRYRVRVHGKVDEKALADLKDGIAVDGVFYGGVEAFLDRQQGTNAWLTIGLREGKNREVKNILGALGLDVTRLIRVSYGPFQLGELEEGAVQELKGKMLRDQLGERLIEESGANFEAPINKPFSNKPVRAGDERSDRPERTERPERPSPARGRLEVGEGGLIKNRKRGREGREDVLGRLTTKPDRGFGKGKDGFGKDGPGKDRGPRKPGERTERTFEAPGPRKANVWMAPGARPKREDGDAAKSAGKPAGRKPSGAPKGGRSGRSGGGPRGPRKG